MGNHSHMRTVRKRTKWNKQLRDALCLHTRPWGVCKGEPGVTPATEGLPFAEGDRPARSFCRKDAGAKQATEGPGSPVAVWARKGEFSLRT